MSLTTTEPQPTKKPTKKSKHHIFLWTVSLVGAVALNGYFFSRINQLEVEANTLRHALNQEIARVQTSSTHQVGETRRAVDTLREKFKASQTRSTKKVDANSQWRTKKLAESVSKKQREQQELLLGEIETVSGKTQEGVNQVRGDLGQVRGELGEVKTDLDHVDFRVKESGAALKATRGHLMDLDGEVGRNRSEITDLRRLGEREYVPFILSKSKTMTRVGGISMRLKGTSPKHSRYSLEMIADDRKIEQKKKHVHEALRFYLAGSSHPFEIVVTSVGKDKVSGYVSKAKVEMTRGSISPTS